MAGVIRINDTTSGGGKVLQGSSGMTFQGRAVSCIGDKVYCAEHGETVIAEGDDGSKLNGRSIALHNHRCGCGCTLITSLPNAGRR